MRRVGIMCESSMVTFWVIRIVIYRLFEIDRQTGSYGFIKRLAATLRNPVTLGLSLIRLGVVRIDFSGGLYGSSTSSLRSLFLLGWLVTIYSRLMLEFPQFFKALI